MEECQHTWHEFYSTAYTKMRECYTCGELHSQSIQGIWMPVVRDWY